MEKKRNKVIIAMSGGVDSSVAASLLKKRGFQVTGIFMKCWSADLHEACTAQDDERQARLAAQHLGIPFYVLNFIDEYKKRVVDFMLEGYEKGITPNPDVMCNKEIKFGLFFDKALQLGADYIATGHYARIEDGKLLKAKDDTKDQSYFLSFIRPEVLERTLFPIGEYPKTEVRKMAKAMGLPNAERKDSQGVCFIGNINFSEFLKAELPGVQGLITDTQGNTLGTHEGSKYYTIGQRKGIGLGGGPWYVAEKDNDRNILVVTKEEGDILRKELVLEQTNFFGEIGTEEINVEVSIRYRQPPVRATLSKKENGWRLVFDKSQRAVTPGQIAVLYKGDEVFGGGIIV
ncbi:MAG: tRNA 2-thiouridine(34) synthase MnmA [bacterium]|nr:tRNA 2-thiouridine(34) synthase MnmA [bacterium]